MIMDQIRKTKKENRPWKDIGILDSLELNKRNQLINLFNILIDECDIPNPECINNSHNQGNSYYYLPCIVRIYNGISDRMNRIPYMSDEIIFDINDFISYFNSKFDGILSAMESMEYIDCEAESVALLCTNYIGKIHKIFRDEKLAEYYLNNIKHSLPTSVKRNININKIIS